MNQTLSCMDMSTFGEYLGGRPATEEALGGYLKTLGSEWMRREFKRATTDPDFGVREAVAALGNSEGGEVFLGVDNSLTISGTSATTESVAQTLSQEGTRREDWCETNLSTIVSETRSIAVRDGQKRVLVMEVRPPGVPVFVQCRSQDDRDELLYCFREGDRVRWAGTFTALKRDRQTRRAEVLRNLYLEFELAVNRVNAIYPTPLGLPYLENCLQDGTFLKVLTKEDQESILGRADPQGGIRSSFTMRFLDSMAKMSILYKAWQDHLAIDETGVAAEARQRLLAEIENLRQMIEPDMKSFKDYVRQAGILIRE